jgi:hypothetical protein
MKSDSYCGDRVLKSDETPRLNLVGRMSQLVVRRGPNPEAATKERNTLEDLDSFLHSLWIDKIAANPGLYSDAKGGIVSRE